MCTDLTSSMKKFTHTHSRLCTVYNNVRSSRELLEREATGNGPKIISGSIIILNVDSHLQERDEGATHIRAISKRLLPLSDCCAHFICTRADCCYREGVSRGPLQPPPPPISKHHPSVPLSPSSVPLFPSFAPHYSNLGMRF